MCGNNTLDSSPDYGHVSPVSEIQRQFWVLHNLAPHSPAYNVPSISLIEGNLNVTALEQAINALLLRHPIFSAAFAIDDSGLLVQKFSPCRAIPLPQVDLRPSHGGDIEAEVMERAVNEEVRRPFNLSSGPLLRFKLFRMGESSHLLAITAHHIIFDLATNEMVALELAEEYSAALMGCPRSEVPERTDYAAFSAWQKQWLQSDDCKVMEEEWSRYLDGFDPAFNLSAGKAAGEALSRCGEALPLVFAGERLSGLRAFCRQEGVTPFLLLLTAWALTLARWSGQKRLCVGVPFTNRRKEEFKRTMGCFVNILPLPVDISDSPTMRDVLRRVRQAMLRMHRMQELPYYRLVRLMRGKGVMTGNPLFQIGFTFAPPMKLRLEGLNVKPKYFHQGGSQLDLFATFWEGPEEISGVIEYDSGLYDPDVVKNIGDSLLVAVDELCARPDLKVDDLMQIPEKPRILISNEELKQLSEWNATLKEYPKDVCLHQLFEAQAEKTPERAAVSFEGNILTYRELNRRANKLAHYLRRTGVGPDTLVGLFMDRSLEMVVAIYAIMKAGGAYVPLDPEYPAAHIAYMLQDTGVQIVLTRKCLEGMLPSDNLSEVLCLDSGWDRFAGEREENPLCEAKSGNLAYVIYTSGSTGRPKGVMNEHRGIVNRLLWMQDEYALAESDTVLQKTPYSFDVSVWEFFWPLLCGARLVMARPGGHRDTSYLVDTIIREGITTIHFVPSMLRAFLENERAALCFGVKRVFCSGEALSCSLQRDFFKKMGMAELHNLYGPTEAAVDVTYWRCRKDGDLRVVPIGRPVANTRIYILDEKMRQLPVNVPGELYIGGVQVARGYLNRPELTAERFVPDQFSGQSGARLYKTGDIGRFLSDGSIEYLGRNDFQLKIRGQRIEAGEIEAVLDRHPSIKRSLVTSSEETAGDKVLVGYVVPVKEETLSVSELRSYLKERIPEFMVPAAFVLLKEFPVTPNGKIDRKILPAPSNLRPDLDSAYVHPRSEVERVISSIWQSVLCLEKTGINDNFFDLGGDSLRMIQVQAELCKALQKELTILELFEYPTIRSLSEYLSTGRRDEQNSSDGSIGDHTAKKNEAMARMKRRMDLNERHGQLSAR